MNEIEIFGSVGGEAAFYALVDAFYQGVESDPPLRALYPTNLGPAHQHLTWFLIQRFGGPDLFDQRRGPPRLRMRHIDIAIDQAARDAWMRHMTAALDAVEAFAPYRTHLVAYFDDAATFMINRPAGED